MSLDQAVLGTEYIIKDISTVVSRKKNNCVVSIKDGRYNIDIDLAKAILI